MQSKNEKEVILGHTAQWFQNSEWSMERFAHELLAPALQAEGYVEGLIDADDGDAHLRARKAWRQRVDRIFNGSQPFPLEWKWAWVNSIAEPFRSELLKDLQLMAGMIPVIRPELRAVKGIVSAPARIAEVMIECAEFFQAAAPAAQDGRYDQGDRTGAAEMVEKGWDAVGSIVSELKSLAAGTGYELPLGPILVVRGVM